MDHIAVSKFKATCLAVLERVRQTGEPILVTKRGEALVEIVPAKQPTEGNRRLGTMAGRASIVGDVIAPAGDANDWDALSG